MEMIHDDNGHQGVEHTAALVQERFYWALCYMIFKVWSKIVSVIRLLRAHAQILNDLKVQ